MRTLKIMILTAISLAAAMSTAYSREQLDTIPVSLGEIVVTSLRIDRQIKNLPVSMVIVDSALYQKRSAFTMANVLEGEPGISRGGDGVWATNI
ncbi:MAG TPA: hypothetical protein DDW70_02655, partial [Rikenellaceae bacterium]|nr:hypothetical protein [Rikenellaceae bacterium]